MAELPFCLRRCWLFWEPFYAALGYATEARTVPIWPMPDVCFLELFRT